MKRLLFATLLSICFLLIHTNSTFAEPFSMGLTPPLITVTESQPSLIEKHLTIENFSDNTAAFTISLQEFSLDHESGQVSFVPTSTSLVELLKRVSILDENGTPVREITLAPKQTRTLTLKANVLPTDQDGTYLFSVILRGSPTGSLIKPEETEEPVSSTTILGGMAANVIIQIGKNLQPEAVIDTFSTSPIIKSSPVPFLLKIKNSGKQFIKVSGTIKIKNIFGATVGKVEVPERIILSEKTRVFTDDTNEKIDSAIQNINSTKDNRVIGNLTWRDPVFFGPYTAVAELSLGNDNPPLVQSVNFFVFPTYALAISIVAMLFLLWFSNRIRKHLQS